MDLTMLMTRERAEKDRFAAIRTFCNVLSLIYANGRSHAGSFVNLAARRQSCALSAINIDSDKSLNKRSAAICRRRSRSKGRGSARLIEIYVDNIERAINIRRAELHKSISDSRSGEYQAAASQRWFIRSPSLWSLPRTLFLFVLLFPCFGRVSLSRRRPKLELDES